MIKCLWVTMTFSYKSAPRMHLSVTLRRQRRKSIEGPGTEQERLHMEKALSKATPGFRRAAWVT